MNQPIARSTSAFPEVSKSMLWAGRILTGLLTLFFLFDSLGKVFKIKEAVDGSADLGYPESTVIWIGLALLIPTVLYIIPRTSFVGAILITAYLGGATTTQVRVEDAWFIFPAIIGVLVWVALYLRDARMRAAIALALR